MRAYTHEIDGHLVLVHDYEGEKHINITHQAILQTTGSLTPPSRTIVKCGVTSSAKKG